MTEPNQKGFPYGCVTTVIIGIPLVGLALLGLLADQCGDPGYTDCEPATIWLPINALGIALAAGVGVRAAVYLAAAIRHARAARRDDIK